MKLFSLIEANKTLPLVKQIVLDIQKSSKELLLLKENFKEIKEKYAKHTIDNDNVVEELNVIDLRLQKIEFYILRYLNELESIGCVLRDVDKGTIDFPAKMGNSIVCLCWNINEADINYWHDTSDDSDNRKIVDERFLLAHC